MIVLHVAAVWRLTPNRFFLMCLVCKVAIQIYLHSWNSYIFAYHHQVSDKDNQQAPWPWCYRNTSFACLLYTYIFSSFIQSGSSTILVSSLPFYRQYNFPRILLYSIKERNPFASDNIPSFNIFERGLFCWHHVAKNVAKIWQ